MRSVNLTKLCMEENDNALYKEVRCNHGFLLHMKTSWTSRNPDRRFWACPYYEGLRSCDFWCWRDREDIDSRSKYVIPKLIEKLVELENLVESSQYIDNHASVNEVEKVKLNKFVEEPSHEVDKPKESKDDNCVDMKLQKLEEEVEKIKEREKK
ncbi:putative MATE efflux family protein 5-like [Capsicum annuum]|uniref:GRF-type domain-containing protein n=1 Tax=Capsicum annuum TaxID=4072 RepID=A0A2G3AL10_CAPAN|nr:putative MATE efflux family protein 5-like [Capsicum annuum]KAF3653099.1 putative MATE efflux family protein 5-like [Capsicum annuum]PHT94919.1 hypothetical protein T459_02801 [Capsicum annuum]